MSEKIFLSFISLFLILSMLVSCMNDYGGSNEKNENNANNSNDQATNEEKVIFTSKRYDNIAGDRLVVSLFSGYDYRDYSAADFSEVDCEKLEVKTIGNDTFLYLSIPLLDKSNIGAEENRKNILTALKKIEARKDVRMVFPKYGKSVCTTTIDGFFSGNEITIMPFPEYNNYEYTIDDFKDINCISIREIGPAKDGILYRCFGLKIAGNDKANVLAAIKILEKRDDISIAEPNYYDTINAYTSDAYNTDDYQWAVENISLLAAWNQITGGSTVTVGVIDTGIDNQHPDLTDRINTSISKDFYKNKEEDDYEEPFLDTDGHGTHVAGIINAAGNNNIGIAGVCWKSNVQLVSLKVDKYVEKEIDNVIRKVLIFDNQAVLDAISYATEQGIDILNYSAGGYSTGTQSYTSFLETRREYINSYPGLFVCSAGNDSSNNDVTLHYPSNDSDLNNVISVGASKSDDDKWQNSNYGQETVSIFAPGALILSCYPTDLCDNDCSSTGHVGVGYHKMSGTSMAAPFVTGVAALLLSANPNLTAENLKKIIMSCDDDVSALSELCVSGGRLNAYKAVTHAHTNRYEQISSFSQHKCICTVCDYEHLEDHDWRLKYVGASVSGDNELYSSANGEGEIADPNLIPQYVCRDCGMISLTDPDLLQ